MGHRRPARWRGALMLRLACALGIAALVLLIGFFLRPTGYGAIAFAFVANPLLGLAVLLGLLWWWRNQRGSSDATMAPGPGGGVPPGDGG